MSDAPAAPKNSQQLLADALKEIRRLRGEVSVMRKQQHMPIAVIGMSSRFPGDATSLEAFWHMLREGNSGVTEINDGRWDMDILYDPDPATPGKVYCKHAGLLRDVDMFDAELFGISPVELQSMDPQHRVFLETAWSCIENAGVAPAQLAGKSVGVYVGIGAQDYSQLTSRFCSENGITPWGGTGSSFSAIGGRLAYLLDLHGPALPVDTACSSSLVALHQAVQGLRRGECDAALVGGVMLMLNPATSILFCKAQMLAPDGLCKTFDADANGYVRSEGCGVVMLKRLDDALRDNDNILALIRGTAVNQDGRSQGLTAPNEAAQVDVIRRALKDADITADQVSYIEAHGTGTSLGDPIEMAALATVYCKDRASDNPLWVGSLKTNIGHMESAAGVGALEKVVLSLQHAEIPPHINFSKPSPYIDWSAMPQVQIPRNLQPWNTHSAQHSRLAGISSFGFTGTNAHVIVEQAPVQAAMTASPGARLFKLSAQRPRALRDAIAQQAQFVAQQLESIAAQSAEQSAEQSTQNMALLFARLCYTANRGRNDFRHRLGIVANDTQDLLAQLQQLVSALGDDDDDEPLDRQLALAAQGNAHLHYARVTPRAPAMAWMFAGQGSQYAGMAHDLYLQLPLFRRHLDDCATAFAKQQGEGSTLSLTSLLWGEHSNTLAQTQFTQPALFALEYALARTLMDAGMQPAAVVGHSIGEFAAACIAGVFSLDDAMKLVCARGLLMHELAASGAMLAVFADQPQLASLLATHNDVSICARNAPALNVVGGTAAAVDAFAQTLDAAGIRCKRLEVSHAFHTPMMQPMLAAFAQVARSVTYRAPRVRFYSSVSGALENARIATADYWVEQISACVDFTGALSALLQSAPAQLLEIGPDRTLCGLARQIAGEQCPPHFALQSPRNPAREFWQSLAALYCAGATPNWDAFYRDSALRPLSMPGYVFQRQVYWHPELPQRRNQQQGIGALRKLFYQREWAKKVLLPSLEPTPARGWLLLGADATTDALHSVLTAEGQRARNIDVFSATTRDTLQPTLQQWQAEETQPGGIVVMLPQPPAATSLAAMQQMLTAIALNLLQAVKAQALNVPIWFVVTNAGDSSAWTTLARGVWGGIINVIALEQPEVLGGYIECDQNDAASLAQEILQGDGEDHIRHYDGQRVVARLRPRHSDENLPAQVALDGNASYLVTGGLGSLGLMVTQWLARNGARHIVLVSRSGEAKDNAEQQTALRALRDEGVSITCAALDISDRAALQSLIVALDGEQHPLRGILHAAGAFDLTAINDLDMARCNAIMDGKIQGAWHLHELSMQHDIDLFVTFSSIASVWGSAGNFHYAAANHMLDVLADVRRAASLPVCNINWGPWAQSTMAQHNEAEAAKRGLIPLQPEQGMAAFDALLRMAVAQQDNLHDTVVADVVWSTFLPLMQLRGRRPLFEGFAIAANPSASVAYQKQFVIDKLRAATPADHLQMLGDFLATEIAQTAGITRESFDLDAPLLSVGLDSLMALDLRSRMKTEFEVELPVSVLLEGASTNDLAQHVLAAIAPQLQQHEPAATAAPVQQPVHEEEMLEGEL